MGAAVVEKNTAEDGKNSAEEVDADEGKILAVQVCHLSPLIPIDAVLERWSGRRLVRSVRRMQR